MSKKATIITIALLVAVCIVFAVYVYSTRIAKQDSAPVLSVDSYTVVLSVNDDESKLLEGITAYDSEDGDLTPGIILESVSKFVAPGESVATYAVVDSDKNVAKITRRVVFDDYTSPKFTLSRPLSFDYGYVYDVLEPLGAVDCIDGDLSGSVKMTLLGGEDSISSAGVYTIKYSITNSRGDTSSITLPVRITQRTSSEIRYQPVIGLRKYLVYVEKGGSFYPETYVESMKINTQEVELTTEVKDAIVISSPVDTQKPGVYEVRYEYTAENGYVGTTIMTVVVEE